MKDIISVIVPVYNVQNYIAACLDSLIGQTYDALEIILVDDGSVDDSPLICKKYAETDNRVKYISQKNQGVSAARNTGLEAATGSYITFVDSDDYVAADYFERLHSDIVAYNADIVCCNLVEVRQGKVVETTLPDVKTSRFISNSREIYSDIIQSEETYWSCATGKLFSADLARKARFPEFLKFGEDQIYMYDLFSADPTIYLDAYKGYFYLRHEASATMKNDNYSISRCEQQLKMCEYKLTNLPEKVGDFAPGFINHYAIGVHALARAVEMNGSKEQKKAYRVTLYNKIKWIKEKKISLKKRTKILLMLYRYCPWLYSKLVIALKRKDAQ